MFSGDEDAGGGGGALRCALDALPDPGPGQLLCVHPLPGRLGPARLPDLHLRQQRHQPADLQPDVSEVSLCFPSAVPLQADGGAVEDAVGGPAWCRCCCGASKQP